MAKLSPEDIEKLKAYSFAWHRTQQKLSAKRDKARELLALTVQQVRHYPEGSVAFEYLTLQRRLLELSLANVEAYNLDAKMWEAPTGIHAPAHEARNIELQFVGLRMDLLAMEELLKLVDAALAPPPAAEEPPAEPAPAATQAPAAPPAVPAPPGFVPRPGLPPRPSVAAASGATAAASGPLAPSGAPGTGRLARGTGRLKAGTGRLKPIGPKPEGWDEEVAVIQADPDRRALWERYRTEVIAFRDATAQALAALGEMAPAENAATRLKQLKLVKVPVLNGLAYRVNTALKGLPQGEAQLKSIRAQLVPPPGPGGLRGKAAPGKKPVTDRLFDFFKPPT